MIKENVSYYVRIFEQGSDDSLSLAVDGDCVVLCAEEKRETATVRVPLSALLDALRAEGALP